LAETSRHLELAVGELDRQERILNKPSFALEIGKFRLSWKFGSGEPSQGDRVLLDLSSEVYQRAIKAAVVEIDIASRTVFGEFTEKETDDRHNTNNSDGNNRIDDSGYYRID